MSHGGKEKLRKEKKIQELTKCLTKIQQEGSSDSPE